MKEIEGCVFFFFFFYQLRPLVLLQSTPRWEKCVLMIITVRWPYMGRHRDAALGAAAAVVAIVVSC